ncbi:hypothetical protein FRB96_008859 [Tulasnella sp. 330]|nr:hypothetical protein FRB96_008859 [Tulasnella sp. 330]KAG8880581.1 hypothetical protein FRB97_000676 [Tulasnella sp. 331]
MSTLAANGKDDEQHRRAKRAALKTALYGPSPATPSKALDSSLKRNTALIKRIRQSMGSDNKDQTLKDIDALALEKYVEEIVGAVVEGLGRCKTEKDIWSAIEHTFTESLLRDIASGLTPPSKAALAALPAEQREKEESARVIRQRPLLRIYAELALVGILTDGPSRSGGETVMKTVKDLLSHDPTLSSLPLLSTFLKSYARPFLGIAPATTTKKQAVAPTDAGDMSVPADGATESEVINEEEELIERDIRDRFKKMCHGYYDNVVRKLLKEHEKLQEQDRRNHEAYIKSGEIFEDRQQAYEKMTKAHEKLLTSCQTLSDLLHLPMPTLQTSSSRNDSIGVSLDSSSSFAEREEWTPGGKWEDDEERRFFEDLTDLKDYVPRTVLGIEVDEEKDQVKVGDANEEAQKRQMEEEVKKLEAEVEKLAVGGAESTAMEKSEVDAETDDGDDDDDATPVPTPPRTPSPQPTTGPGQLLTALLAKMPDVTNRESIDQMAVDFAFLNSKASRKRLVKFLTQVQKHRTDLMPYYARLVATLNRYMPDIATDLVAYLEDQFRYLQKKKRLVKELADWRRFNISYISALAKFSLVPSHVILHIFKAYVDDFAGVNIDNIAMLLEGCGRFLMRDEATGPRMTMMVELMRRKQSLTLLDQRQLMVLENAYYLCNPPERGPRQEKERSPMQLFVRHLIYDVLAKKTIDKVLKLIRKLDWEADEVTQTLHKIFTRPWKAKYINISLLAMLTYDLQRYHPSFSIAVVDQVLEDIRRGLEQNIYKYNQRRVATMKFLGELYIYRVISSTLIFDTLWSLVTFGHPDGRPLPRQMCLLDVPDDFFRVRLVCTLLDSCGMCFEKGSLGKKLDAFLTFFQLYVFTKQEMPMDVEFMLSDTLEALRPALVMPKSFEEAAMAVDELFATQDQNGLAGYGDDSDEENDGQDRTGGAGQDDEAAVADGDAALADRPPSPDAAVVFKPSTEAPAGPSAEEEDEFKKELAKMMFDSTQEARKVDKKAVMAIRDTHSVATVGLGGKRRKDEPDSTEADKDEHVMRFTVLSRKGQKQQTRELAVPEDAPLAVETRNAQLQNQVEQQHLKRLVLDYEQREGMEEAQSNVEALRQRGIKVRYAKG